MTENLTQPNSPEPAQGTFQLDNAALSGVSPATNNAPPAPERPSWVSDEYYDPQRGVKLDAIGSKFKELEAFKKQQDELAASRRAEMPETPDGYGALPEGTKLPEGFTVDTENPMWKFLQKVSHEKGLTKKEYADLAQGYINHAAEAQKSFAAKVDGETKELFKQLGDNGSQRIDALGNWFRQSFGDKVGYQLSQTLFTPDIVKAMEAMQKSLTSQGTVSFNGMGRDGAGGGDIEGWDKMTFEQRWNARSQQDRRAN
jgi:hypothetical protein